jgi:hypothetical protein
LNNLRLAHLVSFDWLFTGDKYFILATLPGIFDTWSCNGLCASVETNLDFESGPKVVNGEIFKNLVEREQKVYRGQIIGLSGSSEYSLEHPELNWFIPINGANYEMELLLGPQNPPEPDDLWSGGNQKDPYGVTDPNVPLDFPELEVFSSWTVFNFPQQPLVTWTKNK